MLSVAKKDFCKQKCYRNSLIMFISNAITYRVTHPRAMCRRYVSWYPSRP